MKVKELIQKLKECDPEAEVLRQGEGGDDEIFQVIESTLYGHIDVIIY